MERLYALVAPGGVLIFSVHGMELLPAGEPAPPSGIAFRPVSETRAPRGRRVRDLVREPEFVRGVAARVAGSGARLVGSARRAVRIPGPLRALPAAGCRRGRIRAWRWCRAGALEHGAVENGVVTAEGWAVGDRDERPPDVRLLSRRRASRTSRPGEGAAGARRAWRFAFPVDAGRPDAVVRIEAVSARGVSKILVAEKRGCRAARDARGGAPCPGSTWDCHSIRPHARPDPAPGGLCIRLRRRR